MAEAVFEESLFSGTIFTSVLEQTQFFLVQAFLNMEELNSVF